MPDLRTRFHRSLPLSRRTCFASDLQPVVLKQFAPAGSSEHNDKFHHWQQGSDAGVAIQMEDPKIFWCLVRGSMDNLAMRQVWDGGDVVANIRPQNGVKQVRQNERGKAVSKAPSQCPCSDKSLPRNSLTQLADHIVGTLQGLCDCQHL